MRHLSLQTALLSASLASLLLLSGCGGGGAPPQSPPVVAPPAQPHWSAAPFQVDLQAATGDASGPVLLADAVGNVMAVWIQVQNGHAGINASRYDATRRLWSAPAALEDAAEGNAGTPVMAVDNTGNVTVVWAQAHAHSIGFHFLFSRRYVVADATWEPLTTIHFGSGLSNPALVVDGENKATAAWEELDPFSGFLTIASSRFDGVAWDTPVQVSNASASGSAAEPVLAVDLAGSVIAAWSEEVDSLQTVINSARFDGADWTEPVQIDSSMGTFSLSSAPALKADNAGRVTAVWVQTNAIETVVRSNRFDLTEWRTPLQVSPAAVAVGGPVALAVDSAGNVTAAWDQIENKEDHSNIRVVSSSRFSPSSGLWTRPLTISGPGTEPAQIPITRLAAEANGNVIAVWIGFASRSIVVGNRFNSANALWEAPQQIDSSAAAGNVTSPAITIDGSGRATAAWTQSHGGRTAIYGNRFE